MTKKIVLLTGLGFVFVGATYLFGENELTLKQKVDLLAHETSIPESKKDVVESVSTLERVPPTDLVGVAKKLDPKAGKYKDLDSESLKKDIAADFNIRPEGVFPTEINDNMFTDAEIGDLIPLPVPGESAMEMFVTSTGRQPEFYELQGHVDGMDKGFGVYLSKSGQFINGYIITPEYSYSVVTLAGNVYVLREDHRD